MLSFLVAKWMSDGVFPKNLNVTNIVLIPKAEKPTSFKDLWLVAFCSVVYKIMAKVLANRLKLLLGSLISLP